MSGIFQARVPASTTYERDPRALPIVGITGEFIFAYNGAAIHANDAGNAFWGSIDGMGDYTTTNPTTGTRTVVDVSGAPGRLTGIIGPDTAGGGTVTFTITIDGTPYALAIATQNARVVIGDILRLKAQFTTADNAGGFLDSAGGRSNDKYAHVRANRACTLMDPAQVLRFIKFDNSLKVEVAVTGALRGVTNDDNCGVIWNLDG